VKHVRILGCLLLAAGVAVVAAPSLVLAYTRLNPPFDLGVGTTGHGYQRDMRVYNSFADAAANDNTTPEATYPGALGAALALWKGARAWSSDTFDSQIGGNVGKNFDMDWQGAALNPAAGNTASAGDPFGACSGGVLAYTTPSWSGWSMSFCDNWTWADGPGSPSGGQVDIQGVAAHEYGHALGLDHAQSNFCGGGCSGRATMCAAICGSGAQERTLAPDDINGLEAIYGPAPANKPLITGLSDPSPTVGDSVTITGTDFAAVVNVKFTAGTGQDTGAIPGTVYGVATTGGGTQVTVNIPHEALTGNVFVWQPGDALLSNAYPITILPCQTPATFCVASPNSYNPSGATLSYSGTTYVSENDFRLLSFGGIPPNKTCLAFYGMNTGINVAYGNGRRCIANPFFRVYPLRTSDSLGDLDYPVDLDTLPAAGQISPGQTWGFQVMYRDPPAGGALFNVTDGLITTWCL